MKTFFSRRDFALNGAAAAVALGLISRSEAATMENIASPAVGKEISRNNAAIHQDVTFAAPPARVYKALTDAKQFDKVVALSAAMNTGMKAMLGTEPTLIEPFAGGAISLFGGYVTGRNLELIPGARLVQAWRAGSWPSGIFSIASFALSPSGPETKLSFDHTGFLNDAAEHLAQGWHINYWKPLAKFLATEG